MNSKPLIAARFLAVFLPWGLCASAQTWIASTAPTQAWTSVACSTNGLNLIAVSHDGAVYGSVNAGAKWARSSAPSEPWIAVASSRDGSRFIAASDVGVISASTNSGATWTTADAPSNTWWSAVNISSDGSRSMAAAIDGGIFVSANSGLNWTQTSAPTNQWSSVASSADGSKWIAGADPGSLYLSSDSGVSWATSNVPELSWTAVASSSDGSRLVAAAVLSGIYVSADSGNTWTLSDAPTNEAWVSLASSSDGNDLIAAGSLGGIYTSTNAGLTWTLNQAPANTLYAVCVSADGTKPVAAAYNAGIFIPGIPGQTQSNSVIVIPKGVYQGLFFETNAISPESSGSFYGTVSAKGAFSAKVSLALKSYPITGRLPVSRPGTNPEPVNLTTTNKIRRPGLSALTVSLDFGAVSNSIIGWVSDGNWTAQLEANRTFYSATNSPALGSWDFTFLLPGNSLDPAVAGYGYGAVHVSPTGRIVLKGSLADGKIISRSAFLTQQNQWPLYTPLYGGKGLALGWITLGAGTNAVDGAVEWIRPSLFVDNLYPSGFTNQVTPEGSPFQLTYSAPIVNFNTGVVCFVEGNLLGNFTNQVAMVTNSIVRNLSDNALSLQILPLAGLFKGVVVDPLSGQRFRFSGAMLQNQNIGRGFFLGVNQSGGVLMIPSR